MPGVKSHLANSAPRWSASRAGLVALGIGKGDRVGLFIPVVPEAAVALMACAKIGAVAVPAFSGYGPEPLAARLHAAEAVALITVDGTTRRGKRVPMKDIADAAVALVASVRHVLVVRNDGSDVARCRRTRPRLGRVRQGRSRA